MRNAKRYVKVPTTYKLSLYNQLSVFYGSIAKAMESEEFVFRSPRFILDLCQTKVWTPIMEPEEFVFRSPRFILDLCQTKVWTPIMESEEFVFRSPRFILDLCQTKVWTPITEIMTKLSV
jgi:hypothetical protein